jgi:hypothetical protein
MLPSAGSSCIQISMVVYYSAQRKGGCCCEQPGLLKKMLILILILKMFPNSQLDLVLNLKHHSRKYLEGRLSEF